jgi:hypothetical protein
MAARKYPAYFSDGIVPVRRASPDELFFITIEARPEPDADDYGVAGGAFVNCWVDADDLRTAERKAVALIHEAGWRPHRFDEWSIVSRDRSAGCQRESKVEPDFSEFVDQAFVDGEVCLSNIWPVDAPDAGDGG